MRIAFQCTNLAPVVSWVLDWGPHACAIAPKELRDVVFDELNRARSLRCSRSSLLIWSVDRSRARRDSRSMVVPRQTEHTKSRSFNGVKVFSATMVEQRQRLGETVTAWIAAHPELTIVDMIQAQSSDSAFHCISISLFYTEQVTARAGSPARRPG